MNPDRLCKQWRRAFIRNLVANLATCAELLWAASGAISATPCGYRQGPCSRVVRAFLGGQRGGGRAALCALRYESPQNPQRVALVEDHPPHGPGTHSMQFTAGVVDGVSVFSVSLYKNLGRTRGTVSAW